MDHLTLLGLVAAVAWECWERLMAARAARQARAAEQEPPVLRLAPWRAVPRVGLQTRRVRRAKPQPVMSTRGGGDVVAVLLSTREMEQRALRALDRRAHLCFTSSWAELQQVVAWLAPSAILADPAAYATGDPARHLAHLSDEGGVPVILYTALTPRTAEVLLELGQCGIRDLILYRYDDNPGRFVSAFDHGPPSQAA